MEIRVNLSRFSGPRPLAVVIGHERSGNHFLMNAIAACCGYTTAPYLDFDHPEININFHQPVIVANVFDALAGEHTANVMKSHHQYGFFADAFDQITADVRFFYIYRNPAPVIESFWKFIQGWPWAEGPRADNVIDFAKAQPAGRLLRYQMRQEADMIARWQTHVTEWTATASRHANLTLVRYEALRDNYAATMADVCVALDCPATTFPTPEREDYVRALGDEVHTVSNEQRAELGEILSATLGPDVSELIDL